MVTHVGAAKGMIALINGGQDCASTTVRKLMSQHIYGIIEHHRPDRVLRLQRDVLDRVIRTVAQLLSDADAGARSARLESYLLQLLFAVVRFYARASLQYLALEEEFDGIAEKVLSQKDYNTVAKNLVSIKSKVHAHCSYQINPFFRVLASLLLTHPLLNPGAAPSPPPPMPPSCRHLLATPPKEAPSVPPSQGRVSLWRLLLPIHL